MGQKTNPNILRLGKVKEWNSKYFEKKQADLPVYIFRDIEIKKFLSKFFKNNGLNIYNCKLYYSENSLNVFISYYYTTKFLAIYNQSKHQKNIKILFKNKKSKNFWRRNFFVKNKIFKNKLYNFKSYNQTISQSFNKNFIKKHFFLETRFQRLQHIINYKKYYLNKQNFNHINIDLFQEKVLESLSLFVNKKQNITLHLEQINKNSTSIQTFTEKKKKWITTNLIKLRKFQNSEFFKDGINILYYCINKKESSDFLAKFIGFYLKQLKRPNFFLRFLKSSLKLLIHKEFSQLKRVQIRIKGRLNGAPRAKNRFIKIGKDVPNLTINSKINYAESTAYTSNGTIGIKVWMYEI